MVDENNVRKAYKEVLCFLELVGSEYADKIPNEIIEVFRDNADPEYTCDFLDNFDASKLLSETLALISWLNLEFWETSDAKKQQLIETYKRNDIKYKLKQYSALMRGDYI